eukprot:m.79074 g.79074  ORF g.79074 m.79074 type:complete len:911 (+) comp14612_c0_seq1:120-2852(+)
MPTKGSRAGRATAASSGGSPQCAPARSRGAADKTDKTDKTATRSARRPVLFVRSEPSQQSVRAAAALAFVASLAVYSNSLTGKFVFDDLPAVVENKDVDSSRSSFSELWADNFWGERMDAPDTQHQSYRPLTVWSFRINRDVTGPGETGFHVVNALLHAVVSALVVFATARVLIRPSTPALATVGLLFATHPVHTEAVSGVVGRAELLSGMFALLAFLVYTRAAPAWTKPPSVLTLGTLGNVLATILLTTAAMLSKEQGFTIAGVCIAYDVLYSCQMDLKVLLTAGPSAAIAAVNRAVSGGKESKHNKQKWLGVFAARCGLLVAGSALALLLRLAKNSQHIIVDEKTNPANHIVSFVHRSLTKSLYVGLHAWLLAWPQTLCCDWSAGSIPVVQSVLDPRNAGTLALFVFLGFLIYKAVFSADTLQRKAELSVAIAFLVGPFLPACGLFMEVGFTVAERVLYLPSVGFCLLLVIAWDRWLGQTEALSISNKLFAVIAFACVLGYGTRTMLRNEDWRDELSIYSAGVQAAPLNAKLHHNAAYYLPDDAKKQKEFHLREAIRLYPLYTSAYVNLGVVLSQMGRTEESIDVYKQGIERHWERPLYSTDVTAFYRNLGVAYRRLGRLQDALESYQMCLRYKPLHPGCKANKVQLENLIAQQPASVAFDVPHLTTDNFDAFVSNSPSGAVVMWYAPWCSHCTEMKPDFVEATKLLRQQGVAVSTAAVDCTQHEQLCSDWNIGGYPTVLFVQPKTASGKQKRVEFQGGRTAARLVAFAKEHSGGGRNSDAADDHSSSGSSSGPAPTDGGSGVADLTGAALSTLLAAAPGSSVSTVVLFYYGGNQFSEAAKPVFAQGAALVPGAQFVQLDCARHTSACRTHDVDVFPSVFAFRGQKEVARFDDDIAAAALSGFLSHLK